MAKEKGMGIMIALGNKKPKGEMENDGDMEEGKMVAAEEILSALESKDASGLSDALSSFVDMCNYGG